MSEWILVFQSESDYDAPVDGLVFEWLRLPEQAVLAAEINSLERAREKCTQHQKKMYLKMTQMVLERERSQLHLLLPLLPAIDGLFFQDFAWWMEEKLCGHRFPCYYVSETMVRSVEEAKSILEIGIDGVFASQEASLTTRLAIASLPQKTGMICFGHLPIFTSYRPFLTLNQMPEGIFRIKENQRDAWFYGRQERDTFQIYTEECFYLTDEIAQCEKKGMHYFLIDTRFLTDKEKEAVLLFYASIRAGNLAEFPLAFPKSSKDTMKRWEV